MHFTWQKRNDSGQVSIPIEQEYKETATFQITGFKSKYSHLFFPANVCLNMMWWTTSALQVFLFRCKNYKLPKINSIFAIVCVSSPARFSLLTATCISKVNCILLTQILPAVSTGFCIIPSLSLPSCAALLYMVKQLPRSNGLTTVLHRCLKWCSTTAGEAEAA